MEFSAFMRVEASATVVMNSLALEKKSRGERVYNLSAGEPMIPMHAAISNAAIAAIQAGKTKYPPVAGIPELRDAAAAWMNAMYQTNFSREKTIVTCGGKFGIFAVCQALLEPGDEAVMIAPYWVSYSGIVQLFGGKPVVIETDEQNGWKISLEKLEKSFTKKTKLLFINNAGNPTGTLYTRGELAVILELAKKHDVIVVSDEVYSGLMYDDNVFISCGSFPEYQDRVVIIQSCSKHFAMTGWRVGFVFAPVELIKILSMVQSQSTTGTSSISQWAAVGAFAQAAGVMQSTQAALLGRRNALVQALREQFGFDCQSVGAGLYQFISLKNLGVQEQDSVTFCKRVLAEANVAMVPGSSFGKEGYVRMSFGEDETELVDAIIALKKFVLSSRV